ncbi:Cupredoxin [Dactylonectria macrodidyma]|uniref:Cupredoxin n=1 Tax=Dactylonectria macrodidyma TaxID=307937 RepID=A0A9P9E1U7_9HYPO|nr:Cupredoxin [Dactylonectria macrodidyma]
MLIPSIPSTAAFLLAIIPLVRANPDGEFKRPVIGINGEWPIPVINVTVGDRIVINAHNSLGNQSTSLHFHGLYQNGTNHMDGAAGVVQCGIAPGTTFTYNFTVQQPGTYWYHSHSHGQYPDGLRGPMIINDPDFPYQDEVDEELVLTLSDWYHDEMQYLIDNLFMVKSNPSGAEPVPNNAIMNDTINFKLPIKPKTTYRINVINMGAFAGQYLWIEGHTMRIVEVDGIYAEAADAEMIYLSAAQRVSFLLTTKSDTSKNFPIVTSMDTTLFDVLPDDLNYNRTGWLVYDNSKTFPNASFVDELDSFDDMTLSPYDRMELLPEPDHIEQMDVMMDNLRDGKNYAFFNNITYTAPMVPTLYTVLNAGEDATNPAIYGSYTHSTVLKKGEIVQIVLNNLDTGRHPFHLHGHAFQVVYRSEEDAGTFGGLSVKESGLSQIPMRRDTIVVWPTENLVLRFRADNPGVWLFHCHIEWHIVSGLIATFVEAPLELQDIISLPSSHLEVCQSGNASTEGNASGNKENYLDLTGENHPRPTLPPGFTPRGIVAHVFSCICGILGVAVIGCKHTGGMG